MSTRESSVKARIEGVVIGLVTGIDCTGFPLVAFAGNESDLPIVANTTVQIDHDIIGREVALMFESGDIGKPIVMGLMYKPEVPPEIEIQPQEKLEAQVVDSSVQLLMPDDSAGVPTDVDVDGQRISIRAQQELVLSCGKASVTLTRAGKVIIRGTYVSTRSSGANRIKGGSVQIN